MNPTAKILVFFLLLAVPCGARTPVQHIREDVVFLCDSISRGRETGSPANLRAAAYIHNSFRSSGLWTSIQPFNGKGRNVIGVTPGFYDSYIVVGAHFDGLGENEGNYYPGADSNASGVAAMLALARGLGRKRCRAGIIFVAFDGYNNSLAGSQAFLNEFRKRYKIDLMVNLDILGSTASPVRPERPDYLIALGGAGYSWDLSNLNRETNLDLSYDYYGSSRFTDLFYRSISDQKWFLERRIPSVMFTSGITMDTNKESDTPDKLDYEVLERRITLIRLWLTKVSGVH